MRWRYKKPKDLAEWHLWFAWHPVHTDTQWVWLERVERYSRLHVMIQSDPSLHMVDAPFLRDWRYRTVNNKQP